MSGQLRLLLAVVVTAGVLVAGPAGQPSARAAIIINVDSAVDTSDAVPGDGVCDDGSGQCTLRAAVEESNALGGGNSINLPAATYTVGAALQVTEDLDIVGVDVATTTIHAAGPYNTIEMVAGVTFGVSAVTFTNVDNWSCIYAYDNGGTELLTVDVTDVVFDHCGSAGAEFFTGGPIEVHVTDSSFFGGECGNGCFGVRFNGDGGAAYVDNSTFTGFGVWALNLIFGEGDGTVMISDSSFEDGLHTGVQIGGRRDFTVDTTVSNTSFDNNSHIGLEVSIDMGATVVSDSTASGNDFGIVSSFNPVTRPPELRSMVIMDTTVTGNAYTGIEAGGSTTIERSEVSGGSFRSGVQWGGSGLLSIVESSVVDNPTGVHVTSHESGDLVSITNSTISGNDLGVDIGATDLEVSSATIAGQTLTGVRTGGTAVFRNTIIAGSGTSDCDATGDPYTSLGHNIDGDGTCGFAASGDQAVLDPLLAPLADNGGPTRTRALLTGSPAIDTGDDLNCPPTDQRGLLRPADGDETGGALCDVGAYEALATAAPPPGTITVSWDAERTRHRLVSLGGTLDFTVVGDAGGVAVAHVDIDSWYQDGDPGSTLLGSPEPTTVDVDLTDTGTPGTYIGSLDPEGIVSVASITGEIITAAGSVDRTSTFGLPVGVAGRIIVDVDLDVPPALLPVPSLSMSSAAAQDGDVRSTGLVELVTSRDMLPAIDYFVRVLDDENRTVANQGPVAVRAGLATAVDMTAVPRVVVPFDIEVTGLSAQPLAGIKVTVVDGVGDEIRKATTSDDGRVSGVAHGADIEVLIDPLGLPFAPLSRGLSLTSRHELVPIELVAVAPTAIVSGTVRLAGTGFVTAGARVSVQSRIGDRYFTVNTVTDTDGTYSVEVFQGDVEVSAGVAFAGGRSFAVVTADATIDVEVAQAVWGALDLELRTRYAGDASSTPVDIDAVTAAHFGMSVRSVYRTMTAGGITGPSIGIPMLVGEPIEVCADGTEAGLSSACVTVFPDAGTLIAVATLELTQAGLITGTLFDSQGIPTGSWSATAHRIVSSGTRSLSRSASDSGNSLSLGLLEAGTYEIDIEAATPSGQEHASIEFSVSGGEVVELGPVVLAPLDGRFAGRSGTSVTVSPREILAGERVSARVAAHNGSTEAVAGAVIAMQVPDGVSVVSGSVLLDGRPVAYDESDGWLSADAGDIAAGQTVSLRAWLRTEASFLSSAVATRGKITYLSPTVTTEILGVAVAAVRGVTIVAPGRTGTSEVTVSGRAPDGSLVNITADGAEVATVTTSDGGFWRTKVTLPSTRLARLWDLQATVDLPAGTIRSSLHTILYNPLDVELVEVALHQGGGRRIEFDPRLGVAQFPYVWYPGADSVVELVFNNPDRVTEATVSLGDAFAAAAYDRSLGAFSAALRPRAEQLGDLTIDWKTTPATLDLTPDPAQPSLTDNELRVQLRSPFNTFTNLVVGDLANGNTVSATFPDFGESDLDLEVTYTDASYVPTAADLGQAAATGVPMYVVSADSTFAGNTFTFDIEAFVPDDASGAKVLTGRDQVSSLGTQAVGEIAGKLVKFAGTIISDVDQLGDVAGVASAAGSLGWTVGTAAGEEAGIIPANPWDQLNAAIDLAEGCSGGDQSAYQQQADEIAEALKDQFVVAAISGFVGVAGGPVGLAVSVVGFGVEVAMGFEITKQIKLLKNDVLGNSNCEQQAPDQQKTGNTVAKPVYIYDPSGFAFEVFEDVRLEGVTATVQFSDDSGGPWEVWDADWFGQDNPQVTDAEGRYGWDVPEGWWRVRFDKDGYETAYSDALEVLPPHFDVNVGLVSLAAPSIASATGYEEHSFLEVSFENFVLSDWVNDFNVAVTDEGDNPVPVTISAVGERTTGGGDDVATVFRFDTGGSLTLNDQYTITFDQSVPSYAGIPAGDDLVAVVEIGTLDPFIDDDDSVFEDDIEWMYSEGIAIACNPPANDMFCPDDHATREMIAAFFVRALGLEDDGGGDLFVDDDASPYESDIDRLATAGITYGCNPPANDRFCPDGYVTRGQVAAFFTRALQLLDDGGGDLFIDDDLSVFESDIDRLATAGITYGCNPPTNDRFCPDGFVTLGQLAAFFHRAFG